MEQPKKTRQSYIAMLETHIAFKKSLVKLTEAEITDLTREVDFYTKELTDTSESLLNSVFDDSKINSNT